MRKWLIGLLAVLVILIAGLAGFVFVTALRSEHPVGFETATVTNPDGVPFTVGIWYPTDAFTWPTLTGLQVQFVAPGADVAGKNHPLIILSHGIAGSLSSHADTALALADAGFVVAAPLHTGDNYKDQSAIGTKKWFPVRAQETHLAIEFMLSQWRGRGALDADKIGMFGFSGGGATTLIAIGAVPDPDAARTHCAASKEFGCQLWKSKHEMVPERDDLIHDPRIKAAVIIAPGAGFAYGGYGYVPRYTPVQLWAGEKDESVPTPSNAEVVHRALGPAAEWHLVANAGHFSFMVPCGPAAAFVPGPICKDPPGFDRTAFHKTFNAAVVGFFQKKLAAAPRYACYFDVDKKICFPTGFAKHVELGGNGGAYNVFGARIKPSSLFYGHGLLIAIGLNDYYIGLATDDIQRACSPHWCVYYHKEWERPLRMARYEISAVIAKDKADTAKWVGSSNGLWLRTNSIEEFLEAERAILVGSPDAVESELIPLSMLDHAGGNEPCMCEPVLPITVCRPPIRR